MRRTGGVARIAVLAATLATATACGAGGRDDAGAGGGAAAAGDGGAFRPLAIGEAVPAYAAVLVGAGAADSVRIAGEGAPATASDGGALTLVNVWATWCTSCREEFADLERLHRDYAPRGVRVVAVSVDESSDERVARFARREGVTFTIAHDPEGRVQRLYQAVGVPETYLVSPDGRLLWRHGGALRNGAPEARQAIEQALASSAR